MNTFTMLIGLPAVGKSTYTSQFPDAIVVSSDAIRESEFGNASDQTHNEEVFKICHNLIRTNLKQGKDVIFDATNLNRKRRVNLLHTLPKRIRKVAVMLIAPFEVVLERNAKRDRVVPEAAMWKMLKKFQPASVSEGFDDVIVFDTAVLAEKDKMVEERLNTVYELEMVPQDNPHHKLTIGEHCRQAAIQVMNQAKGTGLSDYYVSLVYWAALLHDIGKKETKVFRTTRGEVTNIAHFYGHENVSAYKALVLTSDLENDDRVEIANLISLHMVFYSCEKDVNKKRKMYGEEFWRKLAFLHKADTAAH